MNKVALQGENEINRMMGGFIYSNSMLELWYPHPNKSRRLIEWWFDLNNPFKAHQKKF